MRMLLSRFSVLNKAFIFHSIVLYPLVDNYKSMNRLHFISLLVLVSSLASAQQLPVYSEYAYRQYTTQDGLPKMYTECVFQDSQGFIWVGTLHGAVRYNGFQFESFDLTKNAGITVFRESENKNLMAFAFDAYYIFDYKTEKFTKKAYPTKLHISELNSRLMPVGYAFFNRIEGDKEDKILCRIAGEKVETVLQHPLMNGMSNSQCPFLDVKTGLIYLPCDLESTINIVSLSGKMIFSQKMTRPYAVFKYQNKIYCVAESGVYRWNDKKFELFIAHRFPVAYSFIKTAIDTNGHLIISDLKQVFRMKDNRLEKIFNGANLTIDICVDREGNLWLATYQGVFNLFRQQFKNYLLTDKKDMFRVIAGNPDGKTIITGTFDGKLISLNAKSSKILNYAENPNGSFFENYCATLPDAIFLPAAGRVMKFSNNKPSWLNIPHQDYRCVASTPEGNLIAGWEKSFLIFSPDGKLIRHLQFNELKQFGQSRPCYDARNNLYIGGDKGITKITQSTSTLLTNPEFPTCWVIRSDNNGDIWGGARNNLILVKNDKILKIRELQGEIINIFFTKSDKMVVGTTKGIYIFDNTRQHFVFYDHLNGYTLAEAVRCDMFEDSDGNVWMPSVGGLACFNPDQLLTTQPTPVLHLLFAESSTDNIHFERLTNHNLSHKETNIRFLYIGLLYSASKNVRYQYRLRGFQEEWSQPVAEREVTFNNLPPGHYTFELKCNAGAPETQTGVISLPIYIKPAFWQTWLFKILIFLLLSGLIAWLAIRYQRRKHEKEIQQANREKEMNELRVQSVRLKSIPHFNSNVLAGI